MNFVNFQGGQKVGKSRSDKDPKYPRKTKNSPKSWEIYFFSGFSWCRSGKSGQYFLNLMIHSLPRIIEKNAKKVSDTDSKSRFRFFLFFRSIKKLKILTPKSARKIIEISQNNCLKMHPISKILSAKI